VPAGAHEQACPACHRINDNYPGGSLSVSGDFAARHGEEIANIARNEETRAKAEHPLERIMGIETQGEGMRITTTSPHLARGIGKALKRAYHGVLDFHYVEGTELLRVEWSR
jgi:mono/diheme cytochrome c family protein